ncbi:hypothetical protein GDO81_030115 [Engystomops pustulosus]|uniref:Uncharacterized protein n=1 Tax=Engystomops pustulosus TaxID=76066 RepID=A0AAV6YCR7_ENGPU|nr:hypothetical protein GDO81_030115 [Engystomops pustulosus]
MANLLEVECPNCNPKPCLFIARCQPKIKAVTYCSLFNIFQSYWPPEDSNTVERWKICIILASFHFPSVQRESWGQQEVLQR